MDFKLRESWFQINAGQVAWAICMIASLPRQGYFSFWKLAEVYKCQKT